MSLNPRLNLKVALFLLVFLGVPKAFAAPLKFMFFYPGGQGSQEQAQPLLDSFAEDIKRVSEGKLELKAYYFSDAQEGFAFIAQQKPEIGVISRDLYESKASELKAESVAVSLQLPSADGQDQFFILGGAAAAMAPGTSLTVYSSRPLEAEFVKKLFPEFKITLKISPYLVGKLRGLAQDKESQLALLDQFEYANVRTLKTPWAQTLKTLASSSKVPAAPVVLFGQGLNPEQRTQLQKTLLALSKDAAAQETLGNLRLKGFGAAR